MKLLVFSILFAMMGCGQEPAGNTKGTLVVIGDVAEVGVDILKAGKRLDKVQKVIDNLLELVNKKVGADLVAEGFNALSIRNKAQDRALKQLITERKLNVKDIFEDVDIQKKYGNSPYWSPKLSETSKKRTEELHAILKRYIETVN